MIKSAPRFARKGDGAGAAAVAGGSLEFARECFLRPSFTTPDHTSTPSERCRSESLLVEEIRRHSAPPRSAIGNGARKTPL